MNAVINNRCRFWCWFCVDLSVLTLSRVLSRLTAQRSIEDAEEIERERRQRAREDFCRSSSGSMPEESSPEAETGAEQLM